ncbi:hypothetical protein AMTRI_Chr04g185540 [Amborella trichopoda]|uniref:Cyclin-dependent kinase inhibitor domain-containing protein n=1 Tax=Amborella trichopoda TaxID=13333 RepID=W1NN97_AMBTC|nr:cyclin-dependent kinase inhibitor 3 [Amborella trichopoda]ERM97131.1 hypothetical protein AMTR_s00126p00079310 [Amborella trichopoda]|eukprot:XP_006829715.1 cyclin-dependent kinase inhibitor 3 [Amborella trichopoda]
MGKYMRKCRGGLGGVAVMELAQVASGVRTRARSLALARASSSTGELQISYLELRNRKLVKVWEREKHRELASRPQKLVISSRVEEAVPSSPDQRVSNSSSAGSSKVVAETGQNFQAQISLEENNTMVENNRERRETTPCSNPLAESDAHDSTEIPAEIQITRCFSGCKPSEISGKSPPTAEIEEFFAMVEREEQRRFSEKYNYDVVKDEALCGRYEWVRLKP